MQKQPHSPCCFVCGLENVAGVKAPFQETVCADGAAELPGCQRFEDEE